MKERLKRYAKIAAREIILGAMLALTAYLLIK